MLDIDKQEHLLEAMLNCQSLDQLDIMVERAGAMDNKRNQEM